ncbi:MAG: EAL domain-containing protein [Oligoflexia bacterium]|nr:EAL domain-containing protein [Oligoflexia bacterium]
MITPIARFPFQIGRRAKGGLRLHNNGVSSHHAELIHDNDQLWVRDLDSTNGTYVNRRRVSGQHVIRDGDVLHFATSEFIVRLVREEDDGETTVYRSVDNLPQRMGGHELVARMLSQRAVDVHFQPLVDLADRHSIIGWEALGRGTLDDLPRSPVAILALAEQVGRAQELSELLRVRAMDLAIGFGPSPTLFLNCHPIELGSDRLVESMAELRAQSPDANLVLEIHEEAVTDVQGLRTLVVALSALGIRTAYDDFGAGQARLLELVEATPAFVKFDKAWVCGLDQPTSKQHRLVKALVKMVLDCGITPVCEGIETAAQAQACVDVGFKLAQGFYFGRPGPASGLNRN